jgi:mitogen-activated protein kinase kinase kinase 5
MTIEVVCVISLAPIKSRDDKGAESGLAARKAAFADIEKTCANAKAELIQLVFEKLDFGATEALDRFYNADVAIVDLSVRLQQSSLFYHIGVRENMGMRETVILLNDTDPEFTLSVKVSCGQADFLPYCLDAEGKCLIVDNLSESVGLKAQDNKQHSLLTQLKKVLKQVETSRRMHVKDKFLADLRKARDNVKGPALATILASLRRRIGGEPQLLSSDIIFNLLISYRDLQDYDAMCSLVDDGDRVPNNRVTGTVAIQQLYSFALNRRNKPGDRDKALSCIQKAIETSETPVPDMICLCGRIYKDKFVDSEYQDQDALNNAIEWYQKGFDVQPNEYAGINLATLLVISGKRFSTSATHQRIGELINRSTSFVERRS